MIRVFGLWPLPVGIVPHRDVASRITLVVKTAFAIPQTSGETATLLPRQPVIRGDEPHPLAAYFTSDDQGYASDLVPRKKEVDVTFVGSAGAPSAQPTIFARYTLGGQTHEIVVQSSAPATEIPLVSDYLRTAEGTAAPRLAPGRPLGARLRRPRVASAAEAPYAPHFVDVAAAEDGAGFQSGAAERRLPLPFDHRAEIFLEGLGHRRTAAGTQRWFWLPGFLPVAAYSVGGGVAKSIPLVCDTVHFDLDLDTVTLVHRAPFSIPLRTKHPIDVVVGLGDPAQLDGEALFARKPEAKPVRVATLAPDGGIGWLPMPEMPAERPAPKASGLDTFGEDHGSTEAIDVSKLAAALPFAGIRAATKEPSRRGSERPPDRAPPPPPSASSLASFDDEPARTAPLVTPSGSGLDGFDETPAATRQIDTSAAPAAPAADLEATNAFSVSSLLAKIGIRPDQLPAEGSGGTLALTPEAAAAALARTAGGASREGLGGTLALTPEAAAAALARHAPRADADDESPGSTMALSPEAALAALAATAPQPSADFDATSKLTAAELMARVRAPAPPPPPPPPPPPAPVPVLAPEDDHGPGTLALRSDESPGGASSFDETGELDAARIAARGSLPFGPGDVSAAGADAVARLVEATRRKAGPDEPQSGNTRSVDVQALLGASQLPFGGAPAPPPSATSVVAPPAVAPPPPPSRPGLAPQPSFEETDHGGSTKGIDIRELMARGKIPFLDVPEPSSSPPSSRGASLEGLPFSAEELEAALEPVAPVQVTPPPSSRRGEMVPTRTDGPVAVATFTWQLMPPQDVLVVVAKASFTLLHGAAAPFEEEPELPLGDVFADEEAKGSLLHASDLAVMKPEVDILVKGHAWAPKGRATAMQVAVRLRGPSTRFDRELAVFGDRTWQRAVVATAPTAPAAFDVIPLAWERSFGGAGSDDNPVGVGFRGAKDAEGRAALPNFEQPGRLVKSPDDTPPAASLAAVNPLWPRRWSKMGTYDASWAKTRWPYFAADFHPVFFQAAPPAQRIAKLEGDELYEIVGLHKERGAIRGHLPGIRLRCFALKTQVAGGATVEIPLRLDTLTFDADRDRMHLVWRGRIDVTDDDAPEIEEIFVTSEALGDAPMTVADGREKHRVAREAPEAAEAAEPPPDPPAPADEEPDLEREAAIRKLEATIEEMRAQVGAAPLPPPDAATAPAPPPIDPEVFAGTLRAGGVAEAEIATLLAAMNPKHETAPPPPGAPDLRALVVARIAAGESLAELDLHGADLRDLDLSKQILAGSDLTEARLERADLSGADLSLARLEKASLAEAKLDGAKLDGADLFATDLTKATLRGASLLAIEAREARWVDVDAGGAAVAEAQLLGCDLSGASFEGANGKDLDLSGSKIDKARFGGASLPQIRLYDVRGKNAVFDRAILTNARCDGAVLTQCSFKEIDAPESIWERAEVTTSTFQKAILVEASFVRATCLKTVFNEADLTNARLRKAKMHGAMFVRANLMDATCERTDFELADLRGANLHAASLQRAVLRHAKTDDAVITQSTLDKRQP